MDDTHTESCGRCAMSTAVALTDGEPPLSEHRIECSESELRRVTWIQRLAGRLSRRLDAIALEYMYR